MRAWTIALVMCATTVPESFSEQANQAQYFYSLDPQQGTYQFGYDTGSLQHQSFREETRLEDGGVTGRYGYVEAGVLRITEYTADHLGYRCRQTVRHLVQPDAGVFVPAAAPWGAPNLVPSQGNREKAKQARRDWDGAEATADNRHRAAAQPALPARVLGKKVAGRYKDFTSVPAVGGTAAVSAWDSAHRADLRDDELLELRRPGLGGTPLWPVAEDGRGLVWQPF